MVGGELRQLVNLDYWVRDMHEELEVGAQALMFPDALPTL